jgi:D-threo-aldose 1-dehydrogenase
MPHNYGYAVGVERAVATLRAVFAGPINFIDTSNSYGGGEAERRIGQALREIGGLPADFVIGSKVDPDPRTGDFSGARVRASVTESLERMGLERLQLLYFHDPERIDFQDAMAPGGAVEALVGLREEGVVAHLGVAGGPIELMRQYLRTGVFDAVISHNRWTLVDRSADALLDEAAERGVAFVNGAPYGGGMLVKGPDIQPRYAYRHTSQVVRDRVWQMIQICERYDVPLAAAALQFSLREPRIASTIIGISEPERVQQTLELAHWPIPDELWEQLSGLTAPESEWLH